jgi:folate-dependent phosphoribosylglycinamide formyltransferase PurN
MRQGLEYARSRSIATRVVDHKAYDTREAFDDALARAIEESAPDLVLLAGFMRVLTEGFMRRFPEEDAETSIHRSCRHSPASTPTRGRSPRG